MEQLVQESIESYNSYLRNISAGCQQIADDLRSEAIQNALSLILQFSEGVNWLLDVKKKLEKLGYPNELEHESIQEFLNEINTGLEMQDFILVADMFEYEIKPFFENCTPYIISVEN